MNKYQEALDVIKKQSAESYEQYCDKYGVNPVGVLKKLIDKETPMLVVEIHVDEFYCPNCHAEISHNSSNIYHPRYCEECGQRLEWKEPDYV